MTNDLPDHVLDYITHALEAADNGEPAPDAELLTAEELEEATRILADIVPTAHTEVDVAPLTENPIAIRLGIATEPPPVAIDNEAVAEALAGRNLDELIVDLNYYGYTADRGWLNDLADGTLTQLPPTVLRALAALIDATPADLALRAIEPYPTRDRSRLDEYLADTQWNTETDDGSVMIASNDHRFGIVVAHVTDPSALTALNVRRVAWEHLTGRWRHTSACVVLSPVDAWSAVVVDAIDCQPHQSAPSGLLSYGPDLQIQPLRAALETYAARFSVTWVAPQPLPQPALAHELIHPDATRGLHDALSGSFREPKKTAWLEVRDLIDSRPHEMWTPFTLLDETSEPEDIEAMLETFLSA